PITTVLLLGSITVDCENRSRVEITVRTGRVTQLWQICLLILVSISAMNLFSQPFNYGTLVTFLVALSVAVSRIYMDYVNKLHMLKSYLDAVG
ncbi:MAG: hypothetical protein AAF125_24705, partial [Chloroflexota bacterium]